MKVLFQSRVDIFDNRGGDTIQIEKTAEELKLLGVEVVIDNRWRLDLTNIDVVHLFGIDWSCEPYLQALNAKKQGKTLILSAIHHSEKEVQRFEAEARYSLRRVVNVVIRSQEWKDVFKNVYRAVFDSRKLYPVLLAVLQGYRNQQKKVLRLTDVVLTQTDKEAEDLKRDFGVGVRWRKIVNGVGEAFFQDAGVRMFDFEDYIVIVGRIEPRKNQLKVVEAVAKLKEEGKFGSKLVVVGRLNKNNFEYYCRFRQVLKKYDWLVYVPVVKYEQMPAVYKFAKVCVSASWFETTGLTVLEAAALGCNVVASFGDTGKRVKEYLGDVPVYCDPGDVGSIKSAIAEALVKKRPVLSSDFKQKYLWSTVAKDILAVYNSFI
ncbi:glycosyltransferase [candidate division WWE3 bacterium]|nr:glycosyltransferase [candidate division WWE3 bacterium]